MQEIFQNISDLWIPLVVCWGLFIIFTMWKPQRFRNSIFLMASLLMTMIFVSGLFGKYSGEALSICAVLVILATMLVPVMLIINGLQMRKKESTSLKNMLSLILGIVIGAGEIIAIVSIFNSLDILKFTFLSGALVMIWVSVFYLSMWILAFVLYVLSIQVMPLPKKADYIIIHGCGLIDGVNVSRLLADRIEKAVEIYKRCENKPVIIPSGGKGNDESISEAQAIAEYLLKCGIPGEKIICEDASETTIENLKNSLEIINSREGGKKTVLVSSNYHIYRCMLYASKIKMKVKGVGAHTAWYYWPSAVLRECLAVFTRLPHIIWIILGYIICVLLPALWMLNN